jgi:putative endonuclease
MLSEAKHLGFFPPHAQPRLLGLHSLQQTLHHVYIGITNNIARRLSQHRHGEADSFTKRYHLNRLVWLEHFRNVNDAIACEKKLKGWRRSRKVALIEQTNPQWLDLSDEWEQQPKFYDRPWNTDEMIRDSSLRSE